MFVEENISLRMTYVVSTIFGTWPLQLTDVPSTSNNENPPPPPPPLSILLTRFRKYAICTVWLVFTVSSHLYYVARSQHYSSPSESATTQSESKYDEIAKVLSMTENWIFNLASIVNICTTYWTAPKMPAIFLSFDNVEKWIASSTGKRKLSEIRKYDLYANVAWLLAIYFVILVTMAAEYSDLLPVRRRDGNLFTVVLQDLGKLSMTTYDLQFSGLCVCLKNRFEYTNETLKEIRRVVVSRAGRQLAFANKRRYWPRYNYDRCCNVVAVGVVNENHKILCDAIADLNAVYQIQIALNLAVCFFNTVSVLFTAISEYRANTDWTLWISGLLWVTYYILRVIMVCTSASAVIEQVNLSKRYLSDTNDRNLSETFKYQVRVFVQRLNNTDIRFILLGLITIDATFLSSAGVAVTTYLVIALQYTYT